MKGKMSRMIQFDFTHTELSSFLCSCDSSRLSVVRTPHWQARACSKHTVPCAFLLQFRRNENSLGARMISHNSVLLLVLRVGYCGLIL